MIPCQPYTIKIDSKLFLLDCKFYEFVQTIITLVQKTSGIIYSLNLSKLNRVEFLKDYSISEVFQAFISKELGTRMKNKSSSITSRSYEQNWGSYQYGTQVKRYFGSLIILQNGNLIIQRKNRSILKVQLSSQNVHKNIFADNIFPQPNLPQITGKVQPQNCQQIVSKNSSYFDEQQRYADLFAAKQQIARLQEQALMLDYQNKQYIQENIDLKIINSRQQTKIRQLEGQTKNNLFAISNASSNNANPLFGAQKQTFNLQGSIFQQFKPKSGVQQSPSSIFPLFPDTPSNNEPLSAKSQIKPQQSHGNYEYQGSDMTIFCEIANKVKRDNFDVLHNMKVRVQKFDGNPNLAIYIFYSNKMPFFIGTLVPQLLEISQFGQNNENLFLKKVIINQNGNNQLACLKIQFENKEATRFFRMKISEQPFFENFRNQSV